VSSGVTLADVRYDAQESAACNSKSSLTGRQLVTQFIGTLRDADTASEPTLGEDGKAIRTSRKYSDQVGQVLARHRA